MKNATGECVASGQGCRYGPYGPNGAEQCEFCGEARSTAAQPAGAKLTPDQVVAIADSHAHGDWVDNYLNLIRDVCDAALAAASGDSTPPIEVVTCLRCGHENKIQVGKAMAQVQGDSIGAPRPEPEAAGQDLVLAERERCATICMDVYSLVRDGAGCCSVKPGVRLEQAARYIREGKPPAGWYALTTPAASQQADREAE